MQRGLGGDSWQVRVSLGRVPETGHYRYACRWVHGGKREAQRAAAFSVLGSRMESA